MSNPESKAEQWQPSNEEVAELIKAQKRSGMSVAAFARQRGIPVWRLYHAGKAKRRRRRKEFIEVAVSPKDPESSPTFEVVVPGGLRVCVPPGFDEAALRRLLGALSSC